MAETGEEKLLAVARHIANTLGHNNHNMAGDILQVFSNFDCRFSKEKLIDGAHNDPLGYAALEQKLHSLDRRISRHVSFDKPIWSNSIESNAFLAAVDELLTIIDEWSPFASDGTVGACMSRANGMLRQAMLRAEDELRSLIEFAGDSFDRNRTHSNGESSRNSEFDSDEDEEDNSGDESLIPVAQPVANSELVIEALPPGAVNHLREIAKRMVASGHGEECSHVYGRCRSELLGESISRLGFQKHSTSEIHKMPWEELENEIERWIKASKVALRILFPSERRLCDRVFSGLSTADLSFTEVCREAAAQLLSFVDAVAIGSRTPEQLFRVLDVFETIRDLIPEFESLFSNQHSSFLRNEAIAVWKRLGEAIRGIFTELENLIQRDPAKAVVPGGGVHPITRYVMNYLRASCRSQQTLEQVFNDNVFSFKDCHYPKFDDDDLKVQYSSSLSYQIALIMDLLERNLEAKSKFYKDPALCSVFMMNNVRYVVQKVKDSELETLLGDDWIKRHIAKVRQCHLGYQRSSWNKVMGCLKVESNGPMVVANVAAKSIKEKLKLFNLHFEEICRVQSSWIVFDDQLREEIRISLEKILLPAYACFIGRFWNIPDLGKHADKYIKYEVEDIEARLNDLFQGSSVSNGGRK